MKNEQIKALLEFDESDLLANREGRLSEEQSQRIREVDRFAMRFLLLLFFVSLAGGIGVGVLAINASINVWLWIGMAVLLLLAAWLFRVTRTKVDDTVQKVEGQVYAVNGEAESETGSSNRTMGSSDKMRVGTEIFANINPAVIEYMQGDIYAVYYTKTTRYILSAEKISDET